jgi:hypothetical protein
LSAHDVNPAGCTKSLMLKAYFIKRLLLYLQNGK